MVSYYGVQVIADCTKMGAGAQLAAATLRSLDDRLGGGDSHPQILWTIRKATVRGRFCRLVQGSLNEKACLMESISL